MRREQHPPQQKPPAQSVHSLQFGSKAISFELQYQHRKTLGITVHPNQQVTVKAPLETPLEKIEEKVRKRAPWILRQQRYFRSFEPLTPPRQYVSGESHLYWGRQYRLKLYQHPGECVKLKGGFFEVYTPDKARAGSLLRQWYQERAAHKLPELAKPWIERFEQYAVKPSGLSVKWMQKRWGSCSPKGQIILNIELVKAPRRCIEYVIVHELCHLVHPHHNRAFFALQTREMPDWQKWKDHLERFLA
ncbi:MAG: M48 family peptidase [Bacteroidetes bacterium]|nr:MAG: M48 family peptidase [Bacteroidota bacterium]